MNEVEQLREALASAKQLAAAQAIRLRQQELVLSGMQAIRAEHEPDAALKGAFDLLREVLEFDQAVVLEPADDGYLCIAATAREAVGGLWPRGPFFERVAAGRGAVTPDASRVPEWAGCVDSPPKPVGAIFVPVSTGQGAGLMIVCADRHGAFSTADLGLVSRMGLLVSQSLAAGHQRRLSEAVQRSEIARQAAVEANEIKSRFFANMSHEIRTPLNGVVAVAELLSRTELAPRQREMADLILDSGRMLERLLNDVLDFAKVESGRLDLEIRPFSPAKELKSVFDLFAARADEKGLTLTVRCDPASSGWFASDSLRVRQVVSNLLSNAVKFTERGGVAVELRVEPGAEAARIHVSVSDTGCGFPPEVMDRLFDRFEQADDSITRQFGGTGLGLPIARSLARMMGGDVVCRATPGEGATFDFWFAAAPAEAERPSQLECGEAAAPVSALKVLVVDDNPNNQRIVGMVLELAGVAAAFADNGAEACEAVAAEAFDVVLMDLQMPVMDGLTATRRIREWERAEGRPRLPIVAVSANAMTHQVEEARAAGADAHVAKPIEPAVLLAAIADLCGAAPCAECDAA